MNNVFMQQLCKIFVH